MPARDPCNNRTPALPAGSEDAAEAAAAAAEARASALSLIPHGTFLLTAAYGEIRGGVVAKWVQQVSSAPPMVVVAIEKGQPLSPVIRDARRFALCQLAPEDRVLRRMFEGERLDAVDPFLGLLTTASPGGAPIPLKAMAWLECELTRHLDVEGNCELYIGLVHAGAVLLSPPATPPPAIPGRDEPMPRTTNGRGASACTNSNGHGTSVQPNGRSDSQTAGRSHGTAAGRVIGRAASPPPKRRGRG